MAGPERSYYGLRSAARGESQASLEPSLPQSVLQYPGRTHKKRGDAGSRLLGARAIFHIGTAWLSAGDITVYTQRKMN